MEPNFYLFVYTSIDHSQFNVEGLFTSKTAALESAKLALSKHQDLIACSVFECHEVETISK